MIHSLTHTPRTMQMLLSRWLRSSLILNLQLRFVRQNDIERLNAEVGYWIGEPFQGLGIVSDALSELISYIFTETDLIRLYALTFDFNEKSMRVLRRNGFKQLAVMHRMGIKNGKIIDMHYYELLKPY